MGLDEFATQYSGTQTRIDRSKIPVYRLGMNSPIVYRCAIAKQIPKNPEGFAGRIVETFRDNEFRDNDLFSVEIARSPWIDFRLSDRALATWLNDFIPMPLSPPKNNASSRIDLCQYAHARCLSLLYSASRAGLITLHPPEKCWHWQWTAPQTIPWLASSQLCLQQPAETALIAAFIDLCDRAAADRVRNWETQALNLSHKILAGDRACQIWGQPLDLARARLALVAVAQRILCWILQEKLMTIPWLEC